MNFEAQGSFEYLILIGQAVLIGTIAIIMLTQSGNVINSSLQDQITGIQNMLNSGTPSQGQPAGTQTNPEAQPSQPATNPATPGENLAETHSLETKPNSYIIEFLQQPVLETRSQSLQEIRQLKKDKKTSQANTIGKNLATELANQAQQINAEQTAFEQKFPGIKTENQYKNTINAISATLSLQELEQVKKDPNVKAVYPNLKVEATLLDSVPLINADKVWQLNSSLQNCSGEPACKLKLDCEQYIGWIDAATAPAGIAQLIQCCENNQQVCETSYQSEQNEYIESDPTNAFTKECTNPELVYKLTMNCDLYIDWAGSDNDPNGLIPKLKNCCNSMTKECTTINSQVAVTISKQNIETYKATAESDPTGALNVIHQADNECLTGKGITIGIIDTGVDYTHPDLGGCLGQNCKVIGGYDFVNNDANPLDDMGHGTHVAATAAGNGTISSSSMQTKSIYYEGDSIRNITGKNALAGQKVSIELEAITSSGPAGTYSARFFLIDENGTLVDSATVGKGAYLNESFLVNGLPAIEESLYVNLISVDANTSRGFVEIVYYPSIASYPVNGVAPDAKIVAYKVLNSGGSGYFSDIVAAIERSIDPNQDNDFSDHLDVINLSLGADCRGTYNDYCGPDDPLSKAIDNTVDNGVTAVISAGNSGPREATIGSPGTARNAITVGASYKKDYEQFLFSCEPGEYIPPCNGYCDSTGHVLCDYWGDGNPVTDQIVSFSSRGPVAWKRYSLIKPDIVAPGALICAARYDSLFPQGEHPYYYPCLDDAHVQLAGTSMAAPHVAGAVALLKQKNPDFTPEEIKTTLKNTAVDLGYSLNQQGFGRIDIEAAIRTEGKPLTAEITTSGKIASGEIIEIIGSANGTGFEKYSIYSKHDTCLEDSCWTKLYESQIPVENSVLYNWDSSQLEEQKIWLRLVVEGQNKKSEAYSLLEIKNTEITQPLDLQKYNSWINTEQVVFNAKEPIEIKGTAAGPNFEKYEAWLCPKNYSSIGQCTKEGFSLPNNGLAPVVNGTLANLNFPAGLGSGFYTIVVYNYYNYRMIIKETTTHIDTDLHEGWPKAGELIGNNFVAVSFLDQPTIADIDRDGKNDLVTAYGQTINITNDKGIPLPGWPVQISTPLTSAGNKSKNIFNSIAETHSVKTENGIKSFSTETKNSLSMEYQAIMQMGPAVGDIDKDEFNEIVIGDNYGYIHVLNHDGTYVFQPKTLGGYLLDPTLADIDNDGFLEIIVGDWSGYLYVLNKQGTELWTKHLEPIPGYSYYYNSVSSASSVADLDNDGYTEIVVGNLFCQVLDACDSAHMASRVWVLDRFGNQINGWPKDFLQEGEISQIVLADIDNDLQKEIIAGFYNGYVYAWNLDGSIVPNWQIHISNPGQQYGYGANLQGPVIGDIDKDGQLEVAFTAATHYNTIYGEKDYGCLLVYDNGSIANGFPVCMDYTNIFSSFYGLPVLANIDSDPQMEIITSVSGGQYVNHLAAIYAVNHDGSIVSGFPKFVDDTPFGNIAPAGDIDNDGKNEFMIGTWRGTTFVYDSPGDSNNEWPVFQHDAQHTGTYTFNKKCDAGWTYYPAIDKCVFNGFNVRLNYAAAVSYCAQQGGYLPSAAELNQACSEIVLLPGCIFAGNPCSGAVRVSDVFGASHKTWHDKGYYIQSDNNSYPCAQGVYTTCGTQYPNLQCTQVEGYLSDQATDNGLVCLKNPR
ncbi:MAG TPA: S8 family serine peptidase [archaeon]|nr:S8 family serine peptidase [archaeon]